MDSKSPSHPTISSATTGNTTAAAGVSDAFREYAPAALYDAIEWTYLYFAWGLREEHPQTKILRSDAERMLRQIEAEGTVARAAYSVRPAQSDGDDILLAPVTAHPAGVRLCFLRQQHCLPGHPCLCLSDFIAPPDAVAPPRTARFLGLFATAVASAADVPHPAACPCCTPAYRPLHPASYRAKRATTTPDSDDTYAAMLRQTLFDRLAEAAASLLHREMLQCFEGEDVNSEVRPAVGYNSMPDQSLIFDIAPCLPFRKLGISLTTNGMMIPHAATCGLVFFHPAARYFDVGAVAPDQIADYARRRHTTVENIRRFLTRKLS